MAKPKVTYEFQDHWQGVDGKWYRWKQNGPNPPGFYFWGDEKPSAGDEVVRPSDPLLRPDLATESAVVNSLELDTIEAGPLNGKKPEESTIRYPKDIKDPDSDYVFFQFGKYKPPFSQEAAQGGGTRNAYEQYNASVTNLDLKKVSVYNPIDNGIAEVGTIILPMPQDLSNELKSDWSAKSFTRLGRTAIAAAAAGRFGDIASTAGDLAGNLQSIQGAVVSNVLNKIPGVGGNLSINDITGSTRGIVLNPNAEVLYDSPNMREIGMVFKMVPRNKTEAANIKKICDAFRAASLPQYGASGDYETFIGSNKKGTAAKGNQNISGDNFIRVPLLCKFTFMKGGTKHPWLAQFKPCAITRVQVNYTPDGTYATYGDGSPVATELSINFLESKVIFTDEVAKGF